MVTVKPRGKQPVDATPIATVGDLRRRLEAVRAAWRPDPTLSDDEPLPRFPTGGAATAEAPGLLARDVPLDALLKKQGVPSGPPELVELWAAEGLVDLPARASRLVAKNARRDVRDRQRRRARIRSRADSRRTAWPSSTGAIASMPTG